MKYPKHIISLVNILRRLPGVGNKTAERYAFQMLEWQPQHLAELAHTVDNLKVNTKYCSDCGCLNDEEGCAYCANDRRDSSTICVVSNIREVFAVEEMGEYRGMYHVLGGLLSPMDGITSDSLRVSSLVSRVHDLNVQEVVIALDSTLEGDATALYLKKELSELPVKITRLAFGIPMGSSLDYIDGGTLAYALSGRTSMK